MNWTAGHRIEVEILLAQEKTQAGPNDSFDQEFQTGRSVQHMMMITEAVKLPHLPVDTSQVPEKRVPMPQGLKVRFRPFGADQPRVNQTTGARHKKKKKHTSSSGLSCPVD
nr:hypothetical protein BaRGS_024230 [Batillaria attramentaria]